MYLSAELNNNFGVIVTNPELVFCMDDLPTKGSSPNFASNIKQI